MPPQEKHKQMLESATPKTSPVGYIELIRGNADFRYLWLGQVVSLLGDWFNLIASAALVGALTESGLAIGGLFVVRMLSQFVGSPIGGVLADRYNRKTLLIVTDLFRAAVVLGFLLVDTPEEVWLLYVLTAFQLFTSGLFIPARDAILPDVVTDRELGAANAINAATWSTMLALGAALGGFVAGQFGLRPAFIIDSLTFVLSAGLILRVNYTTPDALKNAEKSVKAGFLQYVDGLRFLAANHPVLVIALQKASMALAVSSVFQIIQVELSSKVYVIGEGGSTSLGLFYAMVGIGTGIGPILSRYFTHDDDRLMRLWMVAGYVVTSVGMVTVAMLGVFPLTLGGVLLRGLGVAITWVFSTQILLQTLPGDVRGRVFGTEFAMVTLMNAFGAGFGGWLLDSALVTIPQMLWGMATLNLLLCALWVWLGLLKPVGPLVLVEEETPS